jgi:hypothetical protein
MIAGISAAVEPKWRSSPHLKQTAKERINNAINARSRGIADIVRGPIK